MAGKSHLDCQKKVSGLCDLTLHDHKATVVVHFFCGEKPLLVPADDGQLNFIPRDSIGRTHAENVGGHLDVGRKREVIVGYSQRQALALLIFITRQALTATARKVRTQDKRKISAHLAGGRESKGCGGGKRQADLHPVSVLQPGISLILQGDMNSTRMTLPAVGALGEALPLSEVLPLLCRHRWIKSGTSAGARVYFHLHQPSSPRENTGTFLPSKFYSFAGSTYVQ